MKSTLDNVTTLRTGHVPSVRNLEIRSFADDRADGASIDDPRGPRRALVRSGACSRAIRARRGGPARPRYGGPDTPSCDTHRGVARTERGRLSAARVVEESTGRGRARRESRGSRGIPTDGSGVRTLGFEFQSADGNRRRTWAVRARGQPTPRLPTRTAPVILRILREVHTNGRTGKARQEHGEMPRISPCRNEAFAPSARESSKPGAGSSAASAGPGRSSSGASDERRTTTRGRSGCGTSSRSPVTRPGVAAHASRRGPWQGRHGRGRRGEM